MHATCDVVSSASANKQQPGVLLVKQRGCLQQLFRRISLLRSHQAGHQKSSAGPASALVLSPTLACRGFTFFGFFWHQGDSLSDVSCPGPIMAFASGHLAHLAVELQNALYVDAQVLLDVPRWTLHHVVHRAATHLVNLQNTSKHFHKDQATWASASQATIVAC